LTIDRHRAAEAALAAAQEAAELVMRVYGAPFDVEYKEKDDPVTIADREANSLLCDRLARAFPGVPVVAEESDPIAYQGFRSARECWFVDPLDGTREFVAKNGEFAVMVGLAEQGRATLGVIVAPAWRRTFVGLTGEGAWEVRADGSREPIRVSSRTSLAGASIVVSRSRPPVQLTSQLASLGARETVAHGSSGLKGALVATGKHDAYLQPGPAGMRWDACATEALVRAAGGECTDANGTPFDYSSSDLLNSLGLVATNGLLHGAMLDLLRSHRHA